MEKPMATPGTPTASRTRRALVIAGAAFVAYGLIGAVVVPPLAKKAIAAKLAEKLGRVVEVDDLSVNPYTLEAAVTGVRVLEADRRTPFASFNRLDIDASIRSLTSLAPVADEVELSGLRVRLVRDGENHYNVSDLLARFAAAPKSGAKSDDEPRFSVSNIRLTGARIDFDDRLKGTTHVVSDIDIAIPFVSNLPVHLKEYVQPRLYANVNGAPLHIRGETLPFENSLRTHVALQLDGFDVPHYVGYSPSPLPVRIDSGKLDGRIAVSFTQAEGKAPAIEVSGNLALRDLAVSDAEGRLAHVGRAEVEIASLDPLGGTARIAALRVSDLEAGPSRWRIAATEANGLQVDLRGRQAHVDSFATRGGVIALKRRADGSLEIPMRVGGDAAPAESPAPWHLALASATIDDYRISVADASVKPAAAHRVAIAHLEAHDLSSEEGAKSAVNARLVLGDGGAVEMQSTVGLQPLWVEATLDARRIDLVPFRPYVEEFRTVDLKSGRASAKGRFELRSVGGSLRIAYTGTAEVAKVTTVDIANREDLLNWDSVRARGLALAWGRDEPFDLAVAEIAVDKAYSRVVVTPEGVINLQQLKLATPENPAPAPQSPESLKPRNVRIDRIAFTDSRLNFTDHFIKPNYTADVGELNGAVTGLSSDPAARAVVDLKGSYDKSSPVVISGTINPLSGDLFLDIAAKGKDIELPRFSAYSIRYAGYGITEGKLSLDVKYHVENGKLEGRNTILLEQLTFGEKVEGPDATKLPVLFAVNLLKDSQGRINLELPIAGSLQDPQFNMGGLLTQVVGSLLKKAITSPFSLLTAGLGGAGGGTASAASGADDLAFVAFDPGRDEAGEAERGKLERISKALLDRPAIRIEVAPHVDADKDLAALRRAALRARLQKASGSAWSEAEYPRYLKAAYEREFPARNPGDAKQAPKQAPKEPTPEEMEARLMERIPIGDDELRALAQRRAQWVRGYLVTPGGLAAERVLIAATDGGGEPGGGRSRVDFTLK